MSLTNFIKDNKEQMKSINETFDIVFNDDNNSNNKGFSESADYCREYIASYAGSNHSYFADYKNGTVSIVGNISGKTIEIYSAETGELLAKY